MKKKDQLAIDVAAALIKTAEFLGLDEEGQDALSSFISVLSDDESEYLKEKTSKDSFDAVNSLFSIDIHNATLIVFDVEIPIQKKSSLDLSKINVVGLVKNTTISNVSFEDSSSIIFPYLCKIKIISEIDHEKIKVIERTPANTKDISREFSVYLPSEEIKVSKKFI